MAKFPGRYSIAELEAALRALGEEPRFEAMPKGKHSRHVWRRTFKGVINHWASQGSVSVQGADASKLEPLLKQALGGGDAATAAGGAAAAPPDACVGGSDSARPGVGEKLDTQLKLVMGGSKLGMARSVQRAVAWHLFTDGSCRENRNVTRASPAGWGVAVYGPQGDGGGAMPSFELYGPVVVDDACPLSLGADVGSNNTGELSAIGEALLWLLHEAPGPSDAAAVIHYDSVYAAKVGSGEFRAHKNIALARRVQGLFAEASKKRELRLSHVKGHSGAPGNERADHLANLGATGKWSQSSHRWCTARAARLAGAGTRPATVPSALARLATAPSAPAVAAIDLDDMDFLALEEAAKAAVAESVKARTPVLATPARADRRADGEATKRRAEADESPPSASLAKRRRPSAGEGGVGAAAQEDPRSHVLCGPHRGAPLLHFAQRFPEDCARYIAELQSAVSGSGLLGALRVARSERTVAA
eukprot:CAMPEP_0176290046 /NCGR_PEP_ID=MMETSP0121_2-20121125/54816_1 /TAXON_ID=160619 /ORGANISM="Kryptoperidinium foliaceum, Strain CCMP 1326" /LENGTH=475 /DNA_ID=CAMNT_0017630815 /DNA_START=13 /DNA_END=1437 /DNA_ORIENTATION=-